MSTLTRAAFVETLRSKSIRTADLEGVTANEKAQLKKADLNGDGVIKGDAELKKMFERLDTFDKNGAYGSVDTAKAPIARMTEAIATAAGKPRTALRGGNSSSGGSSASSGSGAAASSAGVTSGSSNATKLAYAKRRAQELGLTITSTTGGRHTPGSYHYKGRAVDVAGAPAKMAQFYREMARLSPTEAFHDPIGGIKNGRNIGAIGGHGTHVHVAF
jgi:hypothetical protein